MVGMTPIEQAIDHFKTQQALAEAMGIRQSTVSEWKKGDRPIPIERCVQIDRLTEGRVRRWHTRPNDWHLIWPELIGTDGAPAVPTTQPAAA